MSAGLPAPPAVPLPPWRIRSLAPGPGAPPDLLELLRRRAGPGESFFYLARPARGFGVAAVGALAEVRVSGPCRFERAARAAGRLLRQVSAAAGGRAEGEVLARAALVASFSFDPDGPGRLALPRELWISDGTGVHGVALGACGPDPRDRRRAGTGPGGPGPEGRRDRPAPAVGGYAIEPDRPPTHYRELVERALGAIEAGELEKVVVARAVTVRALGGPCFDPLALAGALRDLHPSCAVFCERLPDGSSLVGATPELLLRRCGAWVESEALAGTAPAGRDPVAAERFLLGSRKERAEHASVVAAITRDLGPYCEVLDLPSEPRPRRHEGVIHLHTPLRGRLRRPHPPLLELAGALHPTPAVAGVPSDRALAFLRRHEALDRGLYGGAVGFLGTGGDGELSVALRCAHLEGSRARLFAGAGVVAGSSPGRELAETRLKLGAVLPAVLEL